MCRGGFAPEETVYDTHKPPFAPTYLARRPQHQGGGDETVRCYEATPFRAEPFPRSGGFCYITGLTVAPSSDQGNEEASLKYLLPPDLVVERSAGRDSLMFGSALGVDTLFEQTDREHATAGLMRGLLRFKNASSPSDPHLCRNRPNGAEQNRPVVLLTPFDAANSLKHWAVTMFAATSLQLHLERDFGLRNITHVIDRTQKQPTPWVALTRAVLHPFLSSTGVREVIDEVPFFAVERAQRDAARMREQQKKLKKKDKKHKLMKGKKKKHGDEVNIPALPSWMHGCFDAVMVGLGGGHTFPPLWMLDRQDAVVIRSLYANHVLAEARALATRPHSRGGASTKAKYGSTEADDRRRAEMVHMAANSEHLGLAHEEGPQKLHILLLEREKRTISNTLPIAKALTAHSPGAFPQVPCGLMDGACDYSWVAESVSVVKFEDLTASQQIINVLGSNVFIVPHGAGTTQASLLPACSIVIEVLPFDYPQLSFLVPTNRAGSILLYMYETTPRGVPALRKSAEACGRPQELLTEMSGFDCLRCKSCEKVAKKDALFNVSVPLLLELVHHGAHLRKQCLVDFPETEHSMSHQALMLAARGFFAQRRVPVAYQELWPYHHRITPFAVVKGPQDDTQPQNTVRTTMPEACLSVALYQSTLHEDKQRTCPQLHYSAHSDVWVEEQYRTTANVSSYWTSKHDPDSRVVAVPADEYWHLRQTPPRDGGGGT